MSRFRSIVRLKLPDPEVERFYTLFPEISLTHVITELLVMFNDSAEAEQGEVEEILSRFQH